MDQMIIYGKKLQAEFAGRESLNEMRKDKRCQLSSLKG